MDEGALDAYVTPIVMKKGRPAFLFTALVPEDKTDKISEIIFRETTTIGIRRYKLDRYKLPRNLLSMDTSYGEVAVKEVVKEGGNKYLRPEFEDCKRIALERNLPLIEVQQTLEKELNG